MTKMTHAIVTASVLPMVIALTGCAHTPITFEKPGVTEAELTRDRNECVVNSLSTGSARILTPCSIDRDDVIKCMKARGYTVQGD